MENNEQQNAQLFQKILNALNAPPQNDPAVFKARRLAATRLLRQFRKKVREQAKDPRTRNVTLQGSIRKVIKSKNPGIDQQTLWQPLYKSTRLLRTFDWRDQRIVPRLRNQGDCGSCWAYVATEAFESSAMMQRANFNLPGRFLSTLEPVAVNARHTLDCVRDENSIGCDGGRHEIAFKHYVGVGIPYEDIVISFDEDDFPKDSNLKQRNCPKKERARAKADGWDYVHLPPHEVPAPRELKLALLEHGPLVVMLAIDQEFLDYGKEDNTGSTLAPVFESKTTGSGNHFVLLIGWDDDKRAWIIQNSFGPKWGYLCRDGVPEVVKGIRRESRGFMYIRWGSNDIGQYAAWVQAPLLDVRSIFQSIRN